MQRLFVFAIFLLFILFSSTLYAVELTIGLIPEQNVFKQVKKYQPVGNYIEKKTGIKIRFSVLSRYGNIIEKFDQEKKHASLVNKISIVARGYEGGQKHSAQSQISHNRRSQRRNFHCQHIS